MKQFFAQFALILILSATMLQFMQPQTVMGAEGDAPAPAPAAAADTPATPTNTNQKAPAELPTSVNVGDFLQVKGQKDQPRDIGNFLIRAVNILVITIGSFAFLAIVIGGVVLVASAGSETGVQKGKDIIKYAIIGLVIAFSAYFIVWIVQSVFFEYQATK